jgi:hypothetical protein
MQFSGLSDRVTLVRTDVSEELITIIGGDEIIDLGTTLLVTSN